MCTVACREVALQLVCTMAAATAARAGGNLAARVSVRVHALSEHSAARLNRMNCRRAFAVRSESPTFLWSCVFTLLREKGDGKGGARGAYRKGNKSSPDRTVRASTCRLPRYGHSGPHRLLNHYRRSSARPAGTARTVYHNLVFRNLILHLKHGSRVQFTVAR